MSFYRSISWESWSVHHIVKMNNLIKFCMQWKQKFNKRYLKRDALIIENKNCIKTDFTIYIFLYESFISFVYTSPLYLTCQLSLAFFIEWHLYTHSIVYMFSPMSTIIESELYLLQFYIVSQLLFLLTNSIQEQKSKFKQETAAVKFFHHSCFSFAHRHININFPSYLHPPIKKNLLHVNSFTPTSRLPTSPITRLLSL